MPRRRAANRQGNVEEFHIVWRVVTLLILPADVGVIQYTSAVSPDKIAQPILTALSSFMLVPLLSALG